MNDLLQQPNVQHLLDASRRVFADCTLENGAIVAANTDKPYFPREASDYRYVWPRDAAFVCLAADHLGLDLTDRYLQWLTSRPEDFVRTKLLYANYATNGRIGTLGRMFQPDQIGTTLWAIFHHAKRTSGDAARYAELVTRLADGLVEQWGDGHFHLNAVDLWEDGSRQTTARMENNHTYSLAACVRGLTVADELVESKAWRKAAKEMRGQIDRAYDTKQQRFFRTVGRLRDDNVDASLLGLVWPFHVVEPDDPRMAGTLEAIERELMVNGGVHRFQFDYFDSEGSASEGSGAWPVLNFWLAIVLQLRGEQQKARAAYTWVLDRVDEYIPEQIFEDFRVGISPLAWSHAMFVLATHVLTDHDPIP